MLVTYPLMAAIQEISARLGRTTGQGIAGIIRRHYPAALLHFVVALLLVANVINIGADLAAMGDAIKLLVGGYGIVYVSAFGVFCAATQVLMGYPRYVLMLKWTTLSLFAYVAVLFMANISWSEAAAGVLIPRITWSKDFLMTLVAILGTTISPYLFFWQASQEAEDVRTSSRRKALKKALEQAPSAFDRIRADTLIGMAFSNIIAISIILATAGSLHQSGTTDIETSAQAAEALRPVAGSFATLIFAAGIVGTGLLAVPVLAGSTAYAVGESLKWPVGLARKPSHAIAFYSVIVFATGLGVAMNFTPINPVKALYWSAVINGVLSVPVMVVMMLLAASRQVMGKFFVRGWLQVLGWLATAAMTLSVLAMLVAWII
jgi:Mn2+/Fe2+ NRAMP family transporter